MGIETNLSGPWYACNPEEANGWWVVSTTLEGNDTVDESADGGFCEPTARLISAAPDLLEAAKQALEALSEADPTPLYAYERRALKAAIDKATGSTEAEG